MVPGARDPVARSLGLGRHLDPLLDLASAHGTHLQLQGTVAAEAPATRRGRARLLRRAGLERAHFERRFTTEAFRVQALLAHIV